MTLHQVTRPSWRIEDDTDDLEHAFYCLWADARSLNIQTQDRSTKPYARDLYELRDLVAEMIARIEQ